MDNAGVGRRLSPTTVRTTARQALLTGFALTIPLFVTLLIIGVLVNMLSNALDPVVAFAVELSGSRLQGSETPTYLLKPLAVVVLLVGIFCIGFVAERRSGQGRIETLFDATIQRIPGVGSLYTSFDEMSEMLLDGDTQSFQEVVLLEYPTEGSYTIAFVTASTPGAVETATDTDEMVTLFMPMAPNPVMGGYVVHVDTDRVYDVEMSVEEGLRSIVTSGVAIGEGSVDTPIGAAAPPNDRRLAGVQYWPGNRTREPTPRTGVTDRESAYERHVDPEHAETPEDVAQTRTDDAVGTDADRPEEIHQPDETIGDTTDHPEAFDQAGGAVGPEVETPNDIATDREEQS